MHQERVLSAFTDPVTETLTPILDSITTLSEAIRNEGTLARSAEIRTISARLEHMSSKQEKLATATGRIVNKVDQLEQQVLSINRQLDGMENRESDEALERAKPRLVDVEYDCAGTGQEVERLLACSPRSTLEITCSLGLVSDVVQWASLPGEKPTGPTAGLLFLTPDLKCEYKPVSAWLTRLASGVNTAFRKDPNKWIVITHYISFIQPTLPSSIQPTPPSTLLLLRHLLYDLLTHAPSLLQSDPSFRPLLSPSYQAPSSHEEIWPLLDVVLKHFSSQKRILWIIDGFEKVSNKAENGSGKRVRLSKFLTDLVEVVERSRGGVRVVIGSGKGLMDVDPLRSEEMEEVREKIVERVVGGVGEVSGRGL